MCTLKPEDDQRNTELAHTSAGAKRARRSGRSIDWRNRGQWGDWRMQSQAVMLDPAFR